jgi:hypothetical protein
VSSTHGSGGVTPLALTWLALVFLALLPILPLLGSDGWPNNHEALSMFQRVEGFRRAYAAGDLLPVWTPFCHHGHGSPWPLLYHRLFTTVAALFAWVLGSTYRGVLLALVLFLFVGASGTAAAARRLGLQAPSSWLAALLLGLSPYTYVDWLIRGASAEFSAMMLFPWLVWACLRLLDEGRGGWGVGLVMTLLFYAHTVMFLYALLAVAVGLGLLLARQGLRPTLRATAQAGLPVLALCGPYAFLLVRVGRYFQSDVLGIWTPDREYVAPSRYLWDSEFRWGQQWQGLTPELGFAVVGGLALLALVALATRERPLAPRAGLLFLALAWLTYAVLQLPLSAPFYRAVPFASLLQFPWRLVAFLTPLAVLMLCVLSDTFLQRGGWRRALALGVVGLAVGAGLRLGWLATHPRYEFWSRARIEEDLARLDHPWSTLEFLPKAMGRRQPPPPTPFLASSGGCGRVTAQPAEALSAPIHFQRITLSVSAVEPCVVYFNQFDTPLVAVEASGPVNPVPVPDGTITLLLPPGEHQLVLRRRGFLELLMRELQLLRSA